MDIPDEAVEAAARRLWELDTELALHGRPNWDEVSTQKEWFGVMDETRAAARSILEVAAPHLRP